MLASPEPLLLGTEGLTTVGAHEAADAVLTRLEVDRLRNRALKLVAELDGLTEIEGCIIDPETWRRAVMSWAGSAVVILAELARG